MNDVLYTITRHLVLAHLLDKPCFLGFLAVQGGYRIIGEGREIKLEGKCSRSKLLSQCIKYLGPKKNGTFQHSSFLAGGATSAARRLVVENGTLKAIWPHSGHYRPTEESFQEFKSFLKDNLVDRTDVKMNPEEEDEEFWGSLTRVTSESEKTEDRTPAPEETHPGQTLSC
ncbi:hypothetical protein U9M48_016735 [Paspalum notatum var. saurae]|uniref:Uncharacterized protein n=1 Tax=Paspalum notatum var. saurae TaxID=547442 RepID=A0AAQ3WNH5_PASNO